MMFRHKWPLALAALFLLIVRPEGAPQPQNVLVLCAAGRCEYHRVTALLIGGRNSLRRNGSSTVTVSASTVGDFDEVKLDRIQGLYRDDRTGIVSTLRNDWLPQDSTVPSRVAAKQPVTLSAAWQGTVLEYSTVASPKVRTPVAIEGLAYFLVSTDAEAAVSQLLQRLLDPSQRDPRRMALILGVLQSSASPAAGAQWREAVLAQIRSDLKRYDDQEGDPSTLVETLSGAVALRNVYLQVAEAQPNKELLDRVLAVDDLLRRRLAIAEIMRKTELWDEYLVKLSQVGVVKWSLPDILAQSKEALNQSARIHRQRSTAFAAEGHLDRAFDEAALAADYSCERSVRDAFYNARILLVNHNQIAASPEYTGASKAYLEQIVRELDQLDPNKEQLILERIRQGESYDPNYLPLQWKKAEFLDKLGKYQEALSVVRRIERNIRLDRQQLELTLGLDGRISTNLLDAIQKSQEETRKEFDAQRYQQALDAAAKGLKADPGDPVLLYYSALAAAFVRQKAAALKFIQSYLRSANMTCAPAEQPEQMLTLYRHLAAVPPAADNADGIPGWMSGVRYRPGEAFYDPVSMSFVQPVTRINSKDGLTTLFAREDRSFLVRFIVSSRISVNRTSAQVVSAALFEAEPKYDKSTLSMLEIGSRATSAGERTAYGLRYLTSPSVDPALVFRFTGKQIARGWAGNPFFHPFIWSGFYVFDLAYDELGRVRSATPIREEAGSRIDPFSEPLQFTWEGDSKRLVSIRGTRSGYLRTLQYDKQGLLRSEIMTYQKSGGTIEYEYLPDSALLVQARSVDNFHDRRERVAQFDMTGAKP